MFFLYLFLAALLVLLSIQSAVGGFRYLAYFRRELGITPNGPFPIVSVIAPCRGLDDGLHENLSALLQLDYPEYGVIFVVDDANDPAVSKIRAVMAANSKLVIAPKATRSSQKAENLRAAVAEADPRSEAFVFVDSDARPSTGWLRGLVAGLNDDGIGAATGYRWFVPERPTIASELRSAWNASIATALGSNTKSNFCWGGAMAIPRDVFERLKIADIWANVVSDDFAVTRTVHAAGLGIKFVPAAMTASVDRCTFGEMLEFTNRQMKITRVYASRLWLLSFFGSGLFCLVMLWSMGLLVISPITSLAFIAAATTLIAVTLCSALKAAVRLKSVKLAMPQYIRPIARQLPFQLSLWAITPFIFLYNCISATVSRTIVWRGTAYELKSPDETVIIAD